MSHNVSLVELHESLGRTIFSSGPGSALTDKEAMDALFGSLMIAGPGKYAMWIGSQEYAITKLERA